MTKQQEFIYRPEKIGSLKCLDATIGVKFSKDIMLMKSFLDQKNIPCEESQLEETPYGLCLRIKRE